MLRTCHRRVSSRTQLCSVKWLFKMCLPLVKILDSWTKVCDLIKKTHIFNHFPFPGGFGDIHYQAVPTKRWISNKKAALGFVVFIAYCGYTNRKQKKRYYHDQVRDYDARIAMEPFLEAERDRNFLIQLRKNRDMEAKLMKNVPGWVPGKFCLFRRFSTTFYRWSDLRKHFRIKIIKPYISFPCRYILRQAILYDTWRWQIDTWGFRLIQSLQCWSMDTYCRSNEASSQRMEIELVWSNKLYSIIRFKKQNWFSIGMKQNWRKNSSFGYRWWN